MLLRHEVFDERFMFEHGIRAEKRRTFKHLKVAPLKKKDGTVEHGGRDLLVIFSLFKLLGRNSAEITSGKFALVPRQSSI